MNVPPMHPFVFAVTRIAQRFGPGGTTGQPTILYGPNAPLAPIAQEQMPRRTQYPAGVNMVWQPRRDWPNLTPFDTLRYLVRKHPLAALCVRVRSQHVLGLAGSVVARNKKAQGAEQGTCDALNAMLGCPDGQTPRAVWLQQLIRDILEVDAPTVYKRPRRDGGLYGLEVIDGATIKPLLDDRGRPYAYQQIIYGVALSQYLGRRVEAHEEVVVDEYAPGELWYQPFNASVTEPYGRAPMEDLLDSAQIYIRKLSFDLSRFTEGNIPAAIGIIEGNADPDQVQTFEDDFNAVLQGNTARGSRIHFVPYPMRIERMQELSAGGQYESAWEERNVKLVCAAYGVTPSELGFTADVNRATSEGQENTLYRISIKPLALWLKTVLFDPIIQRDLGQGQLEWRWDFGESEDRLMVAQVDQIYAGEGAIGGAELRALRYPDLEGPPPPPPAAPAAPAPPAAPAAKALTPDAAGGTPLPMAAFVAAGAGPLGPDGVPLPPAGVAKAAPLTLPVFDAAWFAQNTAAVRRAEAALLPLAPVDVRLEKAAKAQGAIVALWVPADAARTLVARALAADLPSPEPAEDLHITLAYLGRVADLSQVAVAAAVAEAAQHLGPIEALISGVGRFATDEGDGTNALWAAVDGPALNLVRRTVVEALRQVGVGAAEAHPFTPHITLAYTPADGPTPAVDLSSIGPLRFDALTLAWGPERTPFPLGLLSRARVAKAAPDGPPDAAERGQAERAMARLVGDFFAGQLDRLRRWVGRPSADLDAPALAAFFGEEAPLLVRALLPLYDATLAQAIQAGAGVVGLEAAWEQVNAAVLRLARAEAAALAAQINGTTQTQAAQIIADWVATGGTLDDLTDRLALLYPARRAELIAATEVTRLYAKGNLDAWRESGLVARYEWQTAADERVCPTCGPRHGKTFALDDGDIPPVHPGCRCWIIPVVD